MPLVVVSLMAATLSSQWFRDVGVTDKIQCLRCAIGSLYVEVAIHEARQGRYSPPTTIHRQRASSA